MKRAIGVAVDPQERAWIEKWLQDRGGQAELVDIKFEGKLNREKILEYLEQTGLLDAEVDGLVVHPQRFDESTLMDLDGYLRKRGMELFLTTGPMKPSWQIR